MNHYEEETALLKMKGDALRTKLQAQTRSSKKEIYSPFTNGLNVLQTTLKAPIGRSLLVAVFTKLFLTPRRLALLGLGATALYLLNKNSNK
ncbi:hypothetical protein EV693_104101 [Nicoletella semolina]|uniref:YqjK-like protein n=1 Tax=Nicoletella semolina TaxID=271160 RepID=A0A4R2NA45_9PAST|nr:hypothetical protein [Nicoletella semolina]TCP17870.1 hypothetical protein EV693_104101 [Nicoletella semolina]